MGFGVKSPVIVPRTPPRLLNVDYTQKRTYFVTFCVARRREEFANPRNASLACACISQMRDEGHFWLYAYAVMPDHVHLVLRLRGDGLSLSRVVAKLRSAISRAIRSHRTDFAWQRGFYEWIVRTERDCHETIEYVLRNPIRAGLVHGDERYPYSGVIDSWC